MDYLKQMRGTVSRLGIGFSAFLLTGYLLQIESAFVIKFLSNEGIFISRTVQLLLAGMPLYFIGGPICWLIIKDMPVFHRPLRRRFTVFHLAVAFLTGFALLFIGNILGIMVMNVIHRLFRIGAVNPLETLISQSNPWALFFQTVIAAPLFEEFLFRKLLIDRVQQYGDVTAALLSAVLFGLSHGNFYQFFYAFGLGLVFSYVYLNTGKLRYTIAFHAIINFIGSIVVLYLGGNRLFIIPYMLFLLCAIILSIIFITVFHKEIYLQPAPVRLSFGNYLKTTLYNGGMVLFIGIAAVIFPITIFY